MASIGKNGEYPDGPKKRAQRRTINDARDDPVGPTTLKGRTASSVEIGGKN